jgi:hypothetical protein
VFDSVVMVCRVGNAEHVAAASVFKCVHTEAAMSRPSQQQQIPTATSFSKSRYRFTGTLTLLSHLPCAAPE